MSNNEQRGTAREILQEASFNAGKDDAYWDELLRACVSIVLLGQGDEWNYATGYSSGAYLFESVDGRDAIIIRPRRDHAE